MNRLFVLVDREPVEVDDLHVWGQRFEADDRIVDRTEVAPGVVVSTVFLGIDHSWRDDGPPILFETIVFDQLAGDGDPDRYSTWSEAEAGHAATVARMKAARRGGPGDPSGT